ncbi:hypothetical protein BV210_00135 [Halorientalis sp. IM1011]|nr:hypothetical protein BV210_00135 [Halorientalis sp. IM1011]
MVEAFKDYVWRQHKAANTWADERGVRPNSHRFTERASLDRYGRTLGVDRAAGQLWGGDLTTVHVVRRARPFGEDGQPQPPADFLSDLLAGDRNVYRAYQRHIEENHGLQYARLSVLEPHGNGYPHIHDALWVNDPDAVLCETDIYPAVDAHLDAVEQAQPRNHSDAVEVRHDPERRKYPSDPKGSHPTTPLPREVTKYLAGLAPHDEDSDRKGNVPNVLQANRGPLRFYALLWASGIRQWRPDQQLFQRFVTLSQDWYGADDGERETNTETYPDPEDIDTSSGIETVDIDSRPVDYEPFVADKV